MTKDEALRLAWDALEDIGDEWGFTSQRTVPKRKEALTAIKEALAQPEQDWIEQERAVGYREGHMAALAQRTWVGLTDEDKESFWTADQMTGEEWGRLFAEVEAKLKEKNG